MSARHMASPQPMSSASQERFGTCEGKMILLTKEDSWFDLAVEHSESKCSNTCSSNHWEREFLRIRPKQIFMLQRRNLWILNFSRSPLLEEHPPFLAEIVDWMPIFLSFSQKIALPSALLQLISSSPNRYYNMTSLTRRLTPPCNPSLDSPWI